jgi:predicted porin
MKKSLLAVAAMTAFAGAAQAQSSVTVYGILDVGYTGGNLNATNGTTGVATKTTTSRISNSMESGSRLGFRGTEDLGGGLSANFTYEMGVAPAGDQGATTAAAAGVGAIRQAWVGLAKKGLGDGRVGTQNTLFWEQAGANTTGQLAQTLGSMLAPTSAGAFSSSANANSFSSAGVITGSNGAATDAYTSRTTNTIRVATERMAGIIGKAAYTLNNQDQTQGAAAGGNQGYTGGTNNQSGYQLALDYVIQKANIQASYAAFTSENPYSYTAAQVAGTAAPAAQASGGPAAWVAGVQGTNVKDNQTLITGSYDFGILKAYAGWTNRKLESSINSNIFLKRSAQEIGVRSFITPTIEGWASVGNGRFSAYGAGQPTANITGYQVGSNYWMSKRTNLYAIYGQNGTSSTTNGSFKANQYSIGARHTF